ncbi:hypothetical protein WDW89_09470 [Deltaproteobacteria bacterium TL4]
MSTRTVSGKNPFALREELRRLGILEELTDAEAGQLMEYEEKYAEESMALIQERVAELQKYKHDALADLLQKLPL